MDSSYLTLSLLNAFLSYTSTMLNIVTIHAIRKTPSLSKNLKALLLSQAVSDLGVGLLAQPIYVARLIMKSKLNSGTNSSYNATLFVTALSGSNTGINHVHHYTLTLELLHSSLNPLIYCWKMKHVRHTVIGILRNALKLSKHH